MNDDDNILITEEKKLKCIMKEKLHERRTVTREWCKTYEDSARGQVREGCIA